MKRIALYIVIVLTMNTWVFGQKPVQIRRSASAGGFVDVHIPFGTLQVKGVSGYDVAVDGTLVGDQAQLVFNNGEELTTIKVVDGGGHLTVAVPVNSRVEVRGDSLDVNVVDAAGIVQVFVPSGFIEVSDNPREALVESREGRVDVNVSGSRVRISSQQGPVALRVRRGEVDVSTVSGAITADGEEIVGRFQSVSGNVAISAAQSRIHASSGSGKVTLNLKGGEADVSTMSGPISAQGDRFESGRFESYTGGIRFESGPEQNGRLRFEAHNGEVDLNIPGTSNEVVVVTQSGPVRVVGNDFERGRITSRTGNVHFEGGLSDKGALDVQTDGAVELVLPEEVDARFRIGVKDGQITNEFGQAATDGHLDFSTGRGNSWIRVEGGDDVVVRKRESKGKKPQSEADALFQAIVARIGQVPRDESLDALRSVLQKDSKYAPAHYELARLYMSFNTPSHRQWAQRAVRQALRLDSDNTQYQLLLGDLMLAQGFYYNAQKQYAKVLEMAPDNADAAYKIGYQKLKSFLDYSDMTHLDKIHGSGGTTNNWASWKEWGEKDRVGAQVFLAQSIEADPDYRDAYYQLGLLHLESGRPDSLVIVSRKLLDRVPDDKDALLFCALGFQRLKKMDAAADYYTRALKQMSGDELAVMESVDLIATESEKRLIASTEDGVNRFWFEHDPLFLTDYNEQQLAHYGRIAYANLRFSRPERKIEGWQTDMGRAYIKYGQFLGRNSQRGDYEFGIYPFDKLPEDAPVAQMAMTTPTFEAPMLTRSGVSEQKEETWFYEGFQLRFHLPDGSDGHQVSKAPDERRFNDPYQQVKYAMPYQVSAFREQDSVRVEMAYVLPNDKLGADADRVVELEDGVFVFDPDWTATYRHVNRAKVFLPEPKDTTSRANDLRNHLLSMREVRVAPGTYRVVAEARDGKTGSIGTLQMHRAFGFSDTSLAVSDLLVASKITSKVGFPAVRDDLDIMPNPARTFSPQDPMYVYLEVYNLEKDQFGQTDYEISYRVGSVNEEEIDSSLFMAMDYEKGPVRFEIEAEPPGQSDMLASRGSPEGNPNRDFSPEAPRAQASQSDMLASGGDPERDPNRVFSVGGSRAQGEAWKQETLAFLDKPGDYTVKYVLPKSQLDKDRAELVQKGVKMETAVTAEYTGRESDDLIYLQVDVSQVPAGVHKLTLWVTDRHTLRTVVRQTLFQVRN